MPRCIAGDHIGEQIEDTLIDLVAFDDRSL